MDRGGRCSSRSLYICGGLATRRYGGDCLLVPHHRSTLETPMKDSAANYRRLDSQEIIATVRALHARVEARFPHSGLGKICAELLHVAEETVARVQWIQRPHLPLRVAAALLIIGLVTIVVDL